VNISVWAIPYGWNGASNAILNYSAAFVFVTVFTIITRQRA